MINQIQIQSRVDASGVTEPVDVDSVKEHIRGLEDTTEFDTKLALFIKSARRMIENYCSRSFVSQDITGDLEFENEDSKTFIFPYATAVSAVAINELDEEDSPTELASGTDYFVRNNTIRITPGRYSISYRTVPGTPDENIKEAIRSLVAYKFGNPGDQERAEQQGMPEDVRTIIEPYRIPWL